MVLLVTKQEVEQHFQIAIGRKESEFNNFIREAQEFELKSLLPEQLYYCIMKDVTQHNDLLNPHKWEQNEITYQHSGLKAVLIQFVYALYMLKGNIQDTSYGMVVKQTPHSEPVEYKERKDWHVRHRQQAHTLFTEVKQYIDFRYSKKTVKRKFKTSILK